MKIPHAPHGVYDMPVADMRRAMISSGQSLEASGLLAAAVARIIDREAPLPADDKKAARVLAMNVLQYRRILNECLSDGSLVKLATGEILAPVVEKYRPSKLPVRRGRHRPASTRSDRQAVLAKTSGKCAYCAVILIVDRPGLPGSFETDHVLPVVAGGSDDIANLIPACRRCNQRKKAKTALVFMGGNHGE